MLKCYIVGTTWSHGECSLFFAAADEETGVKSPGGMSKLMKLVGSRA